MNKITQFLKTPSHANFASAAMLLLRLVMGLAFILHGWGKMQAPTSWMGPEAPVPGFLQFLAAFSEFGGGIALILGLLTPIACLGIIVTMAVATSMHAYAFHDPFVASGKGQGSFEPALGYLVTAILILAMGPGKFSADNKIFGNR
jgi:putative oxidoreductase